MSTLPTPPMTARRSFRWSGVDAAGRVHRGRLQACDREQALQSLLRQGIVVHGLDSERGGWDARGLLSAWRRSWRATQPGDGSHRWPAGSSWSSFKDRLPWPSSRPARRHRAAFLRQFATLVKAGVPVVQALEILARSAQDAPWGAAAEALRREVATGQPLAAALRRQPGLFAELHAQLVEAGEAAGVLEPMLDRMALHEEKSAMLARQLQSALMYPAVVVTVALGVVAVILTQVVPTFRDVFASFGAELPPLTRLVIDLAERLAQHGWWWVAALWLGLWGARRLIRRSPLLQDHLEIALLRLPVIGPLLERAALARWTRAFSVVFGAGLTLVDSLHHAGQAAGSRSLARATRQVQLEVATGQRMAPALQRTHRFPPLLLQMAAVGEESGAVEHMMGRTADAFEADLDAHLKGLSSLIEPLIILLLGGLIGIMVVAMYLPILQLGAIT